MMQVVSRDVIEHLSQTRVISSEVPNLLVRRLDLLFMSAPFCLRLAGLFRHGDGSGAPAPLPAADPDREHNMFAVNADALVRLTRAVLPAIDSTSAPDSPRESGHLDNNGSPSEGQFFVVMCLTCRRPV
jgi:hypothetical protein